MSMLMTGCKDVEEPIPSYLYISSIDLETSATGEQGADAHDIVDAWVYVDNAFIGVFEMPSTIPVLKSGKSSVTVVAGVKKNGQSASRVAYPFYGTYNVEIDLKPAQVDTIRPVVEYKEAVRFPWLEDFEDNSLSVEGTGSNTTTDTLLITEDMTEVYSYDGDKSLRSGKVEVPLGLQKFEVSTIQAFDIPRDGREIYLELNFKCNTEFVVGVYPLNGSVVTGVSVVNFYSSADENNELQWKKAYVSLKEDLNAPANRTSDFRVFINAQTNSSDERPLLFFDNIKLVHF